MKTPYALMCFVLVGWIANATAKPVVATSVVGNPELGRIDVLSFAPGGVLLIGDGAKRQVVAILTEDVQPVGRVSGMKGVNSQLALLLGAPADGVELIDMAVNPASGRIYLAARKQRGKEYLIVTVSGKGLIQHFRLNGRRHAVVPLPEGDQAPVNRITDVAWAGDRLIAAARCSEEFASKIFSTAGALVHGEGGQLFSAETYHVSHRKWETKAPMSVLIPYHEDGRTFVVGAFSCTPVVKYPLDDLKPGAKVKGISMIELGSGNRPLDMFAYEKDGKASVLANSFRFHHAKRPFGPSPYWSVRFDQELLADKEKVNETATRRLTGSKPTTEKIEMIEPFHGVVQMDRLNEKSAVALREAGDNLDLVILDLP